MRVGPTWLEVAPSDWLRDGFWEAIFDSNETPHGREMPLAGSLLSSSTRIGWRVKLASDEGLGATAVNPPLVRVQSAVPSDDHHPRLVARSRVVREVSSTTITSRVSPRCRHKHVPDVVLPGAGLPVPARAGAQQRLLPATRGRGHGGGSARRLRQPRGNGTRSAPAGGWSGRNPRPWGPPGQGSLQLVEAAHRLHTRCPRAAGRPASNGAAARRIRSHGVHTPAIPRTHETACLRALSGPPGGAHHGPLGYAEAA